MTELDTDQALDVELLIKDLVDRGIQIHIGPNELTQVQFNFTELRRQWQENPITKLFLLALQREEMRLVDNAVNLANVTSEKDSIVRKNLTQVNEIRKILSYATRKHRT